MSAPRFLTHFTKKEVDALFDGGKVLTRGGAFVLLACPAQHQVGRVLVIASKRVGNAVIRNSIRRRIKTVFYEDQLFQKGYDCALIIRKGAIEKSFWQLRQSLLKAFESSPSQ